MKHQDNYDPDAELLEQNETDTEEPLLEDENEEPEVADDKPEDDGKCKTKRRRKRRRWAVAGAVGLGLAIAGLIVYSIHHKAVMKEQLAYEILEQNECIADYEDFLKAYPKSEYKEEVTKRLQTLKSMYKDWDNATKTNTKTGYESFRKKYPESILMGHQCGLKIDSLDWTEALAIGTFEAYKHYLSLHPSGRYAQEASVACGEIDDVTMRDDEKTDVGSRVRGFFAAFSAGNDASALGYLSVPMSECLGQSGGVSRDEILAALHDYNGGVVDRCRFNVGNDLYISKNLDANGVPSYNASCSVDMHATIGDCEAYSSYKAQMTLNSKYRITRLRLIEVASTQGEE